MRQAVVTKFLGPTNTRGSRVNAKCAAGSLTVSWDHALSVDGNHASAAKALVEKLGWTCKSAEGYTGVWVAGGLPDQTGNVFTFLHGVHFKGALALGDGFRA